ncbi:MAG: heme-binding protein [Phycisphaeraceae bacterium]|nr:heme-binding protein [Phycisphaeraceae bacterium]
MTVAGGCRAPIEPSATTLSPGAESARPLMTGPAAPTDPLEGRQVLRVGGNPDAVAQQRGDDWAAGPCRITTPLPEGYPAPTPPGAIELKRYPVVRRAQVGGRQNPDLATNIAFFPLFNHIKRRDIAMTSPVEVDYADPSAADTSWTMSFLYRTADLGPTGPDETNRRVEVIDAPPVTVLAVGIEGPYALSRIRQGLEELDRWLAENPRWRRAGEPRALYYNGPEMPNRAKWSEAQIPVRFVPLD